MNSSLNCPVHCVFSMLVIKEILQSQQPAELHKTFFSFSFHWKMKALLLEEKNKQIEDFQVCQHAC